VAAYHVVWECVVEQWLGVRRTIRFICYLILRANFYSMIAKFLNFITKEKLILVFKLSPCSKCNLFLFGQFPGT